MLQLCSTLSIPVAMDKLEGPSTVITYLDIELDSQRRELRLPPAKLNDLLKELEPWFRRRKTSKHRLLSLIGKLSLQPRWYLLAAYSYDASSTYLQQSDNSITPYYTKQPGSGRHSVVAPVPFSMEWKGHIPRHNLGLSPRSPVLHRCIW